MLKNLLSSDAGLVHFDPTLPLGIACDASNIGIGATLLQRYPNGDEKPIANVSFFPPRNATTVKYKKKLLLSFLLEILPVPFRENVHSGDRP